MNVMDIDIGKIHPYEKNPRYNDQAVDAVVKSIQQFGWNSPIIVDKDMVILAGHTRYKAAQKMGMEKVPCVIAELDEDKARAFRIADNRMAELSSWNYETLLSELDSLKDSGIDLSMMDFDIVDLSEPIDYGEHDDGEMKVKEEHPTVSEPGRIYALGMHRVICLDGWKWDQTMDAVMPCEVFMGDASAVKTAFCGNEDDELKDFLRRLLDGFGGVVFFFHRDNQRMLLYEFLSGDVGIPPEQTIYWVKPNPDKCKADYRYTTMPCFFCGSLNDNSNETNLIPCNKESGFAKPTKMLSKLIRSVDGKDAVLDPFGADADVLIACDKSERQCVAVCHSAKDCDAIRRKYIKYLNDTDDNWEQLTDGN